VIEIITFVEYMRRAVVWSNIFNRVFLSCVEYL